MAGRLLAEQHLWRSRQRATDNPPPLKSRATLSTCLFDTGNNDLVDVGHNDTMAAASVRARRDRIFRSVFDTDISQPTPLISSTEPGVAFGVLPPQRRQPNASPRAANHQRQHTAHDSVTDQVIWDRAWHTVTTKIQLPTSVAAEDSFGTLASESQDVDTSFREALPVLMNPDQTVPNASHTENIIQWHLSQSRQHFIGHVLPLLGACVVQEDPKHAISTSMRTLEAAHRQYVYGLLLLLRGLDDETVAEKAANVFRMDLQAVIGSCWTKGLVNPLSTVLKGLLEAILNPSGETLTSKRRETAIEKDVAAARNELLALLDLLQKVGLAGDRFQVLFAELMDSCMQNVITRRYAGVWTAGPAAEEEAAEKYKGCMAQVCDWVENHYSRLAVEVFSRIGGQVAWTDVEKWREVAIGRLATLRINELFDIVLHWPESKGGLDDLSSSITTPQRRLQLTDAFSATLQRRLLHPGRSTLHILRTYIAMIKAFHVLDHSKVLLERVVQALQLYLCQRDDAIRIVVIGLISDPRFTKESASETKLVELAVILNDNLRSMNRRGQDEELDWDDLSWTPDPVDAGLNYKRPKNEDVIGTLIGALGSQDIFIKEFQSIMAERLLSKQPGFQQELKVLHLLKKRFGEHAMQNCDVMVKDIQDSRRVNSIVRKGIRYQDGRDGHSILTYHSKILSRLYWPNLAKESFKVPEPVAEIREEYERGFEELKTSRKLNWLDHVGSATVELEFDDRKIDLECKTYEAAVIYAFQDPNAVGPVQKPFNEIWETLMIDEDLLELALKFWISKRVLRDMGNQTYEVIERLEDESSAGAAEGDAGDVTGEVQGGSSSSPKKPKLNTKEKERRAVYWQFIVGMLTNSGPSMALGQISMMMKMLIPEGCPWSNEELQEFLGEKIAEDEMELVGGKYRLKKK